MPRRREDFVIYPRKQTKTGQTWYYCTYYDELGRRRKFSTGETVKTKAYKKAQEMFDRGELGANRPEKMTFGNYFDGFWEDGSAFLRSREAKGRPLAKSTISTNRSAYKNYIGPYFSKFRLEALSPRLVEKWQMDILKKEKGLRNRSVNSAVAILSIMLSEAERLGDIRSNPCRQVTALGNDTREKGVLTRAEARELFAADWKNPMFRTANLLAACTGMRIGEVIGLKADRVLDGKILIDRQVSRGEYKKTKTGTSRTIPITPSLEAELRALIFREDQYVFTLGDGSKPVSRNTLVRSLDEALDKIGIGAEERKERNITFHSWRHFFASLMADNHVDKEVRMKVTGHKGEAMLDHYTHVDESFFSAVLPVQELVAGKSAPLSLGGKDGEE